MKIARKGNLISALLKEEEFAIYDIYPEELKKEDRQTVQNKIRCVIDDIIECSDEETQNDIQSNDLKIELIVPNSQTIILNIHIIKKMPQDFIDDDLPNEQMEDVNGFLKNLLSKLEEQNKNIKEEHCKYNEMLIVFKSLSEVFDCIKYFNVNEISKSDLFKNENKFYLYIKIKNDFSDKFNAVLKEFFEEVIYDNNRIAYIKEHSDIISTDAINKLSNI